jgi:hypothetical protein
MTIEEILESICNLRVKYDLSLLYLDYTDVTLLCRLGFSYDIFIQIYANIRKDKVNLALIVEGCRIYGVDREGGYTHEHPIENPNLHVLKESEPSIEDFIIKSIGILDNLGLL